METETIRLKGTMPGVTMNLTALHFGTKGARPKIYIQAGLHADEAPGLLVAHHLRGRLAHLERDGKIRGHVVLVPAANPVGLSQTVLGSSHGRFALEDGSNFNREFPALGPVALRIAAAHFDSDEDGNLGLMRGALHGALDAWSAETPVTHLKKTLMRHAVDADVVLDLHCDGEAEVHLYAPRSQQQAFLPLAARLGAKAMLVASVSGGDPFDEALTRPWDEARAAFPDKPIPMGTIATTVELRGGAAVNHDLAAADAEAIIAFLADRGALNIDVTPVPAAQCTPTPLEGSEALQAPMPGIIVFHRDVGARVSSGMLMAEIIDPVTGDATPVRARTSGMFYARTSARVAHVGRRLGKIAGDTPFRSGKLLSP
jgi:hypothetical protein